MSLLLRGTLRLAIAVAVLGGCKPDRQASTAVPAHPRTNAPSSVAPMAQLVIEGMRTGDLQALVEQMTPELRTRVPVGSLRRSSERLRAMFGDPVRVLEEHTHAEGELQWYSGLVLHDGVPNESARGKPILYQFAIDRSGRLTRLLIREHWFLDEIEPPADDYVPITRFHFVGEGRWYVMHGGDSQAVNYHHRNRNQRWAFDLAIKRNGRQRPPQSSKVNEAYYCHGEEILAPAAGVVVRVVNDAPENVPVGQRGEAGGNGVLIDHGFGEFSQLWHAIPGSVRVKAGDRVEVGQVLANAGNSGRSSHPHVHFHVSYYRNGAQKFALRAEFVDVFINERWSPRAMPQRGDYVRRAVEVRGQYAAGPHVFVAG